MALDLLRKPRTIRQYDKEYVIPPGTLEQIVDIGLRSPTAQNEQDIDLVVCTNRDRLKSVSMATIGTLDKPLRDEFMTRMSHLKVDNVLTGDAPCVIFFVRSDKFSPVFTPINCGAMLMSLIVAAESFGLATMPIGAVVCGDTRKVEDLLGISPGHLLMALAIGKPVDSPTIPAKKITCKARYIP